MNKRTFLKALLAGSGIAISIRQNPEQEVLSAGLDTPDIGGAAQATSPASVPLLTESSAAEELTLMHNEQQELHPAFVHQEHHQNHEHLIDTLPAEDVDSYLQKIRNFDADFGTDIFLNEQQRPLLDITVARLERAQRFVGHANFNLISFDELLYFARNYEAIGAFSQDERDFIDGIFYTDASDYGFFGEKVTTDINNRILKKDVIKIAGSGHFLRRGESLHHFEQIRRDVGKELQLTSGVRNVVKQIHLFLAKTRQSEGNLSKASRSLAPPGHSFHNLGDFDVGKIGLGELNFTTDFSSTEEFQRLITLGYVDIRYTDSNRFGVRYEPWHIKLG